MSERAKSDNLLLSIFPEEIARQLKGKKGKLVDSFDNVTVLFADIVNFTKYSETMKPQELVDMLDEIFSAMDKLADKYQVEKIKTIGDAYMVVGGLPVESVDHCKNVVNFALEVNKMVEEKFVSKYNLQFRMGIHTGRVIAGVIGEKKLSYDLWGKTVNTASRFESHGQSGKIHITEQTKDNLTEDYKINYNGEILIKGLGLQKSYFLETG